MVQPLEDESLTNRRNAVGLGRGNLRALNRDIQRVRFLAADAMRIRARADLRGLTNLLRESGTDAGKRRRQELRHRSARRVVLQHRDELAKFDPVRMRLDL